MYIFPKSPKIYFLNISTRDMSTLQYQLERNRKLLKNQKLSAKLYENAAMKQLGAEGQLPKISATKST
jgi:hypothetical protein